MEQTFLDRGIEQARQQNYQEAINSFSEALKFAPYSVEALYRRGLAYAHLGNFPAAAFDYSDALKIDNNRLEIYYARAFVRLQLENFSGATSDIEAAITLNLNYAPAYQLQGVIQQKLAQWQLAISSFKKAAQLYLNTGDKENCRICLDKIAQIQPQPHSTPPIPTPIVAPALKPPEAYQKILQRAETGDLLGAIADLDWAIRVDDRDARAYCCRGIVKVKLGEVQNAVADFNKAIDLNDRDLVAYRNRGRLRQQLRDFWGARSDLDRAINLDDCNHLNYIERGNLKMAMGDYQGAIADFSRSIELAPEDAKAYLQRAHAYAHQEEMQRSIDDYRTAMTRYSAKADWHNYQQALDSLEKLQGRNFSFNLTNSSNFSFIEVDSPQLAKIGTLAETYYQNDPVTCLIKLRQFGEFLTQIVLDRLGIVYTSEESQHELLRKLNSNGYFPRQVYQQFQELRYIGNQAVHEHLGDQPTALKNLQIARELGIWFRRNFGGDPHFQPAPFQPPT
jgi:tetratricopeptide (TPR) repeat protein